MSKHKGYPKQFRTVILDDEDNVIEVLYQSRVYGQNETKAIEDDSYQQLMNLHHKYDLGDWENLPILEFQADWGKGWEHWSDPVDDFMNL